MKHLPNIIRLPLEERMRLTDWFYDCDPVRPGIYIRDYGEQWGEFFAKYENGYWFDSDFTRENAAKETVKSDFQAKVRWRGLICKM